MEEPTGIVAGRERPQLVLSMSGAILAANPAATDLLEAPFRVLAGKPLVLQLGRDDRRPFLDLLRELRADRAPRTLRCSLFVRSGAPVDVVLDVVPQGQDPPELYVTLLDVSRETEVARQAWHLTLLEAEQREAALALDAALEPRVLDPVGATLGVARRGADPDSSPVGGDVHDWQRLPHGAIHLSVVDATGHGLFAARVALTVRSTARILALSGCPFEQLLDRTETACLLQEPAASATVVAVRYDPTSGAVAVASAGHPPPLVRRASGQMERVDVAAPPLGHGRPGERRPCGKVQLEHGDALVLYTDGVVEGPAHGVEDGIERLEQRLARSEAVEAGARSLAQDLLDGHAVEDDALALVLVHAPTTVLVEGPDALGFHRTLHHPARRDVPALRADLADWMASLPVRRDRIRQTLLVVSELATNAVEADSAHLEISVELDDDHLAVEVVDDGSGLQPERLWFPASNGGRGLRLVDAVCTDVHIASSPAGTVVRAKVPAHR